MHLKNWENHIDDGSYLLLLRDFKIMKGGFISCQPSLGKESSLSGYGTAIMSECKDLQ